MADSAPFLLFAEAAERVAATRSRLEKAAHVGGFFETLTDADLVRAARFAAGRPFSLRDQRTVNVGGAALATALATVAGTTRDALGPRLVALGDAGDVAAEALAVHAPEGPPLTLAGLEVWLADLAALRGTKAKTAAVEALLRRSAAVEAKYVVKLLGGDLRIGLQESGVEAALAKMAGVTVEAVQRANMLTGDVGETALLARHGRLEAARMQLFHPLKFMLATPAESTADVARQMPACFAVEDKYDGIRAQAHVGKDEGRGPRDERGAVPEGEALHGVVHEGVRVALFSRTLDAVTGSFPDLVGPLAGLLAAAPAGLALDGEIVPVAPEDEGATAGAIRPFQVLQRRLGRKAVTEAVQDAYPVAFVVYDALFFDGAVLLETPYDERQAALDKLPTTPAGPARRSVVTVVEGVDGLDALFDAARARGNEGLMVKSLESPYKPGRRGRDWLKVKRALATLDCVVTAVEVGSGKRRHLLSDFTFAVRASAADPTLLNVGKAYSGLTDAELATLTAWFEEHTLQSFAHGRVRTVEPRVVIEVAFDRVQPSARHKSGFALRFPRIVRLRDDKPSDEIDTLDAVRRLAEGGGQ